MENGTTNWANRGDAMIASTTAEKYAGSASLAVTGRTAYWQGAGFSVPLTSGNSYEVSVWVKLAADEPTETVKITGKLVDDADTTTYNEYTQIASGTVTADEWTRLSGTYVPQGQFETFIFETPDGSANVSFYLDNFAIYGEVNNPDPDPTGEGLASQVDFPVGVAVALDNSRNANLLTNTAIQTIVTNNFSQLSAENNMKMSYYNESTFANAEAEQMITWASQHNIGVHGHALVWHPDYQLPSWARTPGADFRQRFEAHVRGVARKHRGQVQSWDVVNEALSDNSSGSYYRDSVFYRQYDNDVSYITNAFRWAREEDPNALLYYNDYNTENGQYKTEGLVALLNRLIDDGAPINGVGFQMHVLLDWPSIDTIKQSWQRALDVHPDLLLKITELDVRINNPYGNNIPHPGRTDCDQGCTGFQLQAARYKAIIEAYLEVVPPNRRGGITIWGIADNHSWYYQHEGNGISVPDWPLLWNNSLQPKPAFNGVLQGLQSP